MSIMLTCEKCGSSNLEVEDEFEGIERGYSVLYCYCEDKMAGHPNLQALADECLAVVMDCGVRFSLAPRFVIDGKECPVALDEVSSTARMLRLVVCYEAAVSTHYLETDGVSEVEADEDSHEYRISCADCHAPIECSRAVQKSVVQAARG